MNGFGLSRGRFVLLFSVMLVAAAGNTAMQSLLPAIGRELEVADIWVAIAFSLSAVLWVVMAPVWAHRADRRGRRALMRLGLYGFIGSMLICGGALAAGLAGWLGGFAAFAIFMLGRTLYGAFGSASPPAVQAYIAARTEGEDRTNAISALASSFGLGTIIGPAIAPLFILPPLGLAAPLIAFAGIGAIVLALLILRLPDDTPKSEAKGPIAAYPALGKQRGARRGGRGRTRPAALARSARPALASDRHRRRPRPRHPPRRDRLHDHRPAQPAARPGPALDRGGADGGRCRHLARPMVADPANGAEPARARPLGLAGRGGRLGDGRAWPATPTG